MGEPVSEYYIGHQGQIFLVKADTQSEALDQAFTSLIYR